VIPGFLERQSFTVQVVLAKVQEVKQQQQLHNSNNSSSSSSRGGRSGVAMDPGVRERGREEVLREMRGSMTPWYLQKVCRALQGT
jgi:hypothetical protein